MFCFVLCTAFWWARLFCPSNVSSLCYSWYAIGHGGNQGWKTGRDGLTTIWPTMDIFPIVTFTLDDADQILKKWLSTRLVNWEGVHISPFELQYGYEKR